MPPFPNEYQYDEEELEAPKPYTAERRAEIEELNSEIAELLREINAD